MCPLTQLAHSPECLQSVTPDLNVAGYCYIDESKGIGNPAFVEDCPDTEKRQLRFLGRDLPDNDAITFLSCAFSDQTCD